MSHDRQNLIQDETAFLKALDVDPYAVFDELRPSGPVHWIEPLRMWYVIDHANVSDTLLNSTDFITGTPGSLVYDTFGAHMMTVDGAAQVRYRNAFRSAFSAGAVRTRLKDRIQRNVDALIDAIEKDGRTDLRPSFANRLPVLSILDVFGLPPSFERKFRAWYDDFEAALANFERRDSIRATAAQGVEEFHNLMQQQIEAMRGADVEGLLAAVVNAPEENRLSDEEIRRNALIIMFGGISTVEALLLNTLFAILSDDALRERLEGDMDLLPSIIEESVRWQSPVQSATRRAMRDVEIGGEMIKAGDAVNCMLGAANRDPAVFADPSRFDIERANIKRHLGFATGPHVCLGNHLARLEAETALERLLTRLKGLQLKNSRSVEFRGYEFRQPAALDIIWNV